MEYETPVSWGKFERTKRHPYQALVPYHQVEVDALERKVIKGLYTALPTWLHEVEVPYGFHSETPPVLSYLTSLGGQGADGVMLRNE